LPDSDTTSARTADPIPARAGIGLRADHYEDLLSQLPPLAFLEVHSENYFGGGRPLDFLERLAEHYPISFHGVGLSLGSCDPLSTAHLQQIADLDARFQPVFLSEHLSFSSAGGVFTHDLVPLPYTEEAVAHFASRIAQVQDHLGRRILVENVSCYLEYAHSSLSEADFVAAVAEQADCEILLDVNNIFVNASNHGHRAEDFLESIVPERVAEIHLAGFTRNRFTDGEILIDTHNQRVAPAVWELYARTVRRLGPRATLIEWDTDLPPLSVLLDEAELANRIQDEARALVA
jgi:hypothetical protein